MQLCKGGIFVEHVLWFVLLDHRGRLVRMPASVYGAYDCSVWLCQPTKRERGSHSPSHLLVKEANAVTKGAKPHDFLIHLGWMRLLLCVARCKPQQLIGDVAVVCCLTSHASVFQGRICSDNFTCCHTEIEAADQTFHLTQSQYTDTGPTSPTSTDPTTPGAWQGSHWSTNF